MSGPRCSWIVRYRIPPPRHATNVLGSASAVIHGWWTVPKVLWWSSLPLYVVLVYASLISDVLRHDKPGLGAGFNES